MQILENPEFGKWYSLEEFLPDRWQLVALRVGVRTHVQYVEREGRHYRVSAAPHQGYAIGYLTRRPSRERNADTEAYFEAEGLENPDRYFCWEIWETSDEPSYLYFNTAKFWMPIPHGPHIPEVAIEVRGE